MQTAECRGVTASSIPLSLYPGARQAGGGGQTPTVDRETSENEEQIFIH